MEMPKNYNETQAAGEYTPIELGGHYLVIKQVEETMSKTGSPMVKISFDTADNDKQPHFFADQFRNDIRPDKKWPVGGVTYMLTEDQDGNCSRNFKGFTTSVENSNPGFSVQWGNGFAACFKNKLVGGIFREELGIYNGKETHQRKLQWFCSNEKVADAKIPDVYETKEHKEWASSDRVEIPDNGDFLTVPDGIDETKWPFN